MKTSFKMLPLAAILLAVSCDWIPVEQGVEASGNATTLQEVAQMLSALPLDGKQFSEVHSAVTSSILNGYDEEYTMKDLFAAPGSGVGDQAAGTKTGGEWTQPLRDLIRDYLITNFSYQQKYRAPLTNAYVATYDNYTGATLQEKIYNYLAQEIGIPTADLDFIIGYLTE